MTYIVVKAEPEPLLARGVPDLKLDSLSIKLNGLDFEVNPDSRDETCGERLIGEAEEQTALTNTTVSDQKKLDEKII